MAVSLLHTARTYRLSHRGQVTDRFTKALERLSSPDVDARLGGTDLSDVDVSDVDLSGTDLNDADLRDAEMPVDFNMTRARLRLLGVIGAERRLALGVPQRRV